MTKKPRQCIAVVDKRHIQEHPNPINLRTSDYRKYVSNFQL